MEPDADVSIDLWREESSEPSFSNLDGHRATLTPDADEALKHPLQIRVVTVVARG